MKILYVGHRYHTNQVPIMKGWNEHGVRPMYLAQYEGVGEVHDHVDFQLLKLSNICKPLFYYIDKMYDPATAESKKINAFIPSLRKTIHQIKTYNPDIVIIRDYKKGNAIVALACKILGIRKVIMYVQDPLYGGDYQGHLLRSLFRKMFFPSVAFSPVLRKGEDRVTTCTSKAHDAPKYFVPLVFPASKVIRDNYCKDGIIHILDIGKYRDYKNHFYLVDAIKRLKDVSAIRVTIIGQLSNSTERDYYERLEKYIKEKHLDGIIQLRGHVDFYEMDTVYLNHDVLVLASKNETAGMVILEAMSQGLCVVSSINCGLTSYLDEYKCGLSFNTKTPDNLIEILNKLAETSVTIKELGQKAQQVVKDDFCFEKYREGLNGLLLAEYNYSIIV